jgi:hypothetical protein
MEERRVSVAEEAGEQRRKWRRRMGVVAVIWARGMRRGSERRLLCRLDRCGGEW